MVSIQIFVFSAVFFCVGGGACVCTYVCMWNICRIKDGNNFRKNKVDEFHLWVSNIL